MSQQSTFSMDWLTHRNKSLAKAGAAIKQARIRVEQLEALYREASFGQIPDIELVVGICHALTEAKNDILVGFVESSAVPRSELEREAAGKLSTVPLAEARKL